jgi:hypothetical protein
LVVKRDEADPVLWESLACIFGGGVRGMDRGMEVVKGLRRHYVRDYIRCMDWIGVDRRPFLLPEYQELLSA